ncbi:MAG TPA: zinc-dependent metalloprotease [Solirubrobacteraceae bacterium]
MIDWIIAERIATFVAGDGDASPPTADLKELAAESEVRVTAYTGLQPAQPLPEPEGIGRREWVKSNVDSMRLLLDPVLESTGKSFGPLGPAMQIGAGLILSTEVGVVLGYLGQRVLGQYELVLLDEAVEDRPPRLLFVMPNLGQAVQAFGAEEKEFMTWVALHEVTHAIQFAGVPWLHGHVAGLVRELLRSAELRIEAPRRLRVPSPDEIRRMLRALREGDLITVVTTHAERETLDRVQAVMAVIEGHAEHVMDAVAPDLLPSLPELRAALDRRRRSQSGLSRLVARLLGLNLKIRQYEQGKKFCDAVVAERGPAALHHVFSVPEALPTLAELDNPRAWLARTLPTEPAADGAGASTHQGPTAPEE